ncbi:MAG: hypothetical protein C0623_10550 [Desulfuromonas sp.]|nr:MAG: hypothetical protein C0623_10550 [Desulfuromonas sp.]
MIEFSLDEQSGILHVHPLDPLTEEDFKELAATVDPYIIRSGALKGLILEVPKFPGWESISAALSHFRFVRDHHRKVQRVAVVTDSMLAELAEHLARHFIAAEIRQFKTTDPEAARDWVKEA